jgi:hypothetical protein
MFENINTNKQYVFIVVIVTPNSLHMFNANELAKTTSQLVDLGVRVLHVFTNMRTTPKLFKTLINFTLAKFDKLFLVMVHTIMHHAQSTNDHHIQVLNLKFCL